MTLEQETRPVVLPGPSPVGDLEPVGLGYRQICRGVELTIGRLREGSGEIRGELTAVLRYPALENGYQPSRHLSQFTLNLSSLTSRKSAAGHLADLCEPQELRMIGTAPASGPKEAREAAVRTWTQLLERFSSAVLRQQRQGHPVQLVGRNPRQPGAAMLLNPLLRYGRPAIVFAPGGTGKTTLAAAVAVQLQSGHEILPGFRGATGPALVLDWETTAEDWNDLIAAICAGAGITPLEVRYRRMARPLADSVEEIAEVVAESAIAGVILDSVEAASGADGDNYNERANRLFDAVRLIGSNWLLLDHVKAEDLERADAIRKPINGIMKLNRAQGGVFELRAEKEPTRDRIEVALIDAKRNGRSKLAPIGLAMCFSNFDDDGQARAIHFEETSLDSDDLAAAALTKPQLVARLLAKKPLKPAQIAEELGLPPNLVRSILNKGKGRRFNPLPDGRWGQAAHV